MTTHRIALAVRTLALFALCSRAFASYDPRAGRETAVCVAVRWHDAARNRDVPARIWLPARAREMGPLPVIIFSHGLGGSSTGYAYLGRAWASAGFVSVHLQHLGSDDAIWRGAGLDIMGAMRNAAANPVNALNRVEDVKFAINKVLAPGGAELPFRADPSAIGVAGHSFGAWTALVSVGQHLQVGRSLADPRIKAAIAMSAPVPGGGAGEPFATIHVPVFHMTGTRDNSPIGETKAADRRVPYDEATSPGSCLLTLNGGDHMVFSGHLIGAFAREDAAFQALIKDGSVAFWDATLRGNKQAAAWLYGGGYKAELDGRATFEFRAP